MTCASADNRELLRQLAQAGRQLDAATLIEYRRYAPNTQERMRQPLDDCAAVTRDGYRMAATELSRCRQAALKAQRQILAITNSTAGKHPAAADHIRQISTAADEMLELIDATAAANRQKRDRLTAFNIILFGRTMTGKSTLMEILTGGDGSTIGKGAQRTTRDRREYTWLDKSLTITDVPGIEAVGGTEDEANAHHAAQSADLILFLITDDGPQPGEAQHLNILRGQGRPLVGVMNVKRAVGSPVEKRRFIRDQSKIFDPVRLYQIKRQFNELIQADHTGQPLDLVPIHMLARFQADREIQPANRDQLECASRFWELESKVLNTIIHQGPYLRKRSFLDTAADANRQTERDLYSLAELLTAQSERFSGRITELRSYHRSFERESQSRCEQAVQDTIGNLRRAITDFARGNYENQNVQNLWDRRIRSVNLDQHMRSTIGDMEQQVQERLSDLGTDLEQELHLLNINIQQANIAPASITDYRRFFGFASITSGIAGIAGSASLIAGLFTTGIALSWNPIGWAMIGLSAITGIIGLARNLFKSRDQKRHEAVAKMSEGLRSHLNTIEQPVRRQLNQARQQLLQRINDVIGQIVGLQSSLQSTAQILSDAANEHRLIRLDIDRQIVALSLEQTDETDIASRVLMVERHPSQQTVITTKRNTPQLRPNPQGTGAPTGRTHNPAVPILHIGTGRPDMTILLTQRWTSETEAVLNQAREAITASPTSAVRELGQRLPASAQPDESHPTTVVFAGQYSAGKSTIIKALTGRDDIAIGAGITTERTETYRWHNASIIDTPGIHTELRPDHDAVTYEAISQADLLAFIITNELFDAHLAEHCCKLMVDREKAAEAILVVNKMNRHADGNTADSRHTITEDLRAFLAPYTPEQLRITFIDAECAIEALDETDPEIKDYLLQEGNLPALVDAMNSIIATKGAAARQTAVLYQIDHVLQQAILSEPSEDPTVQSLVIVYNQNIAAISDALRTINLTMSNATSKTAHAISDIAADLASQYHPQTPKAQLEDAHEAASQNLNQAFSAMEHEVTKDVNLIMRELSHHLTLGAHTTLFKDTLSQAGQVLNTSGQPATRLTLDLARGLTDVISALSVGTRTATGISAASGSALHQFILGAGRFAEYSFAPWQAVRWASSLARAMPFIGLAISLIGTAIDIHTQRQEQRREQDLIAASRQTRAKIVKDGDAEISAFTAACREAIIQPMQQILLDLSDQRGQLTQQLAERSQSLQTLHTASQAANNLIHRIHAEEQTDQTPPAGLER